MGESAEARLRDRFKRRFGRAPAAVGTAPGRVNLIGEHTDYNDGFVLPTPIPLACWVALAPRADRIVALCSREAAGDGPLEFQLGAEQRRGTWVDYPQGVTRVLADARKPVGGFDALIESDVPVGAGLSSSAALDVALLRALRAAFALELNDLSLALLAQRAEHAFAGAMVGVMDPAAISLGQPGSALFLDTRSMDCEQVPLPACLEVGIVDSGVRHQLTGGDYNTRRSECEEAARLLGVAALRDVTASELPRLDALPEPLRRRARHVVEENARVLQAVEALSAADWERVGRLLNKSHASLRDLYEVSTPEVDRLVALAQADPRCFGARMTGGGFGGSIVLLARAGKGAALAAGVVARHAAEGGRARVLLPVPA